MTVRVWDYNQKKPDLLTVTRITIHGKQLRVSTAEGRVLFFDPSALDRACEGDWRKLVGEGGE